MLEVWLCWPLPASTPAFQFPPAPPPLLPLLLLRPGVWGTSQPAAGVLDPAPPLCGASGKSSNRGGLVSPRGLRVWTKGIRLSQPAGFGLDWGVKGKGGHFILATSKEITSVWKHFFYTNYLSLSVWHWTWSAWEP